MSLHKVRPFIDVLMGIMLIFEMFYVFTGNFMHEIVGILFFITLIVHMILSRKWIKGISIKTQRHQKLLFKQKAQIAMMVVLAITFLLLIISSVLISNILSTATGLMLSSSFYNVFVLVHNICAYTICLTTICHVGLHWIGLFKAFKIPYDPQRRKAINTGITALASLGVVMVGIAAVKEIESCKALAGKVSAHEEQSEKQRTAKRSERKQNAYDPYRDGPISGISPNNDQIQERERSQSAGESNSSVCTLCNKRCPLSAPRCNRPYDAGLI